MLELEKLVTEQPKLQAEMYQLKILLKLLCNKKRARIILEESDTLEYLFDFISGYLVKNHVMTPRMLDNLPIGRKKYESLTRNQLTKLSIAAASILEQMETSSILNDCHSPIESNVRQFCTIFGFSEQEANLISLLVTFKNSEVLHDAIGCIKLYNFEHILELLSELTNIPNDAVRGLVGAGARLRSAGVLRMSSPRRYYSDFLECIATVDVLDNVICYESLDEQTMLESLVNCVAPSTLALEDYRHVIEHINHIDQLFRCCENGPSILIYGKPGTGKTELVRLLAQRYQLKAYEVTSIDGSKNSIPPEARVEQFNLAHSLLSVRNKEHLLLFDEVEDVFGPHRQTDDKESFSKAWLNHLLESLKVPTIWLSNSSDIDPAYLRRFSYVLELEHPDPKLKKSLIKKYHPNLKLRRLFLDELTQVKAISIAAIRQACEFSEQAGLSGREAERFIAHAVAEKYKASGSSALSFHTLSKKKPSPKICYPFDPEYVNTSENIENLVSGLGKTGEGRLILFGPPGTGKTSFVHYLSQQLGKPLLQKDAAQLQSCFVGEAEKNIHMAFAEALNRKSILFFDEADSLLTDRQTHVQTWQTSEVNQLLQEVEKFTGILVMSTNLIQKIDPASSRRFDFKIKFDFMTLKQRVLFFEKWLKEHGGFDSYDPCRYQARLQSLDKVVPGHFQLLSRKARVVGEAFDADRLYHALKLEMELSNQHISRPIGFLN
tara:strand:- start:1814 stop:3973 length:2160 start_codon:yes stop_codon:yes gene_type:complete